MDILTIGMLSVITVAGCITFLTKIASWSMILRHHAIVDVLFTLAMLAIFAGTVTGTLVAALSGLMLSLLLSGARAASGLYAKVDGRR